MNNICTQMCTFHLFSKCNKGDNCRFAHTISEWSPTTCFSTLINCKRATCSRLHVDETKNKLYNRLYSDEKVDEKVENKVDDKKVDTDEKKTPYIVYRVDYYITGPGYDDTTFTTKLIKLDKNMITGISSFYYYNDITKLKYTPIKVIAKYRKKFNSYDYGVPFSDDENNNDIYYDSNYDD